MHDFGMALFYTLIHEHTLINLWIFLLSAPNYTELCCFFTWVLWVILRLSFNVKFWECVDVCVPEYVWCMACARCVASVSCVLGVRAKCMRIAQRASKNYSLHIFCCIYSPHPLVVTNHSFISFSSLERTCTVWFNNHQKGRKAYRFPVVGISFFVV